MVSLLATMAPVLHAQEIGDWISVPTDKPHPRIFFDRDEIPAIRQFARTNAAAQPLVDAILSDARAWVDREIDLPDASISGLDEASNQALEYHRAIREPVQHLALAYLLTGEERFARQTKTILLGYAEKYPTYTYSDGAEVPSDANDGRLGVSSLREAEFAEAFALAYDLIAASRSRSSTSATCRPTGRGAGRSPC